MVVGSAVNCTMLGGAGFGGGGGASAGGGGGGGGGGGAFFLQAVMDIASQTARQNTTILRILNMNTLLNSPVKQRHRVASIVMQGLSAYQQDAEGFRSSAP
jgi:hypothetical protein